MFFFPKTTMKLSNVLLVSLTSTSIFKECSALFPDEIRILDQHMSMEYSTPSVIPTIHPSTKPSGRPSVTIIPTRSPSGVPTITGSVLPTVHPSATPSDLPSRTINPTRSPSSAPTVVPSLLPSIVSGLQDVQLRLLFSARIGISPSEVPSDTVGREAFLNVLEDAFAEVISGEVSNITVTLPDGVRRGLQQGDNNNDFLDVSVELVSNQACRVADCYQFSDAFLDNMEQEIDADLLADTINQLAQVNNVDVLATASVLDYQLLDHEISVDGTIVSSSPSCTLILASVVAALATSFLF